MAKFDKGDFVEIEDLEWPPGQNIKLEDGCWGVVVDCDKEENPVIGAYYRVMVWDREGEYLGKVWCGARNLGERRKVKMEPRVEENNGNEGKFKIWDKVRMVNGMEGRLLNDWGMRFEWGVVKEVEGNEVRVGFWKDGMERVEYWCLEEQLEGVERGESGK